VNLLGRATAHFGPPGWLRKLVLDVLFKRTATALGEPMPRLHGLAARKTLQAYGEFTARAAATADRSAEQRLFHTTQPAGVWLRRAFGVRSTTDAMAVARMCYRVLDIDFTGDPDGNVCIARCSFSGVYSPTVCQVMSYLDAGLLAGLTEGGGLVFSHRLTEGHPCCRARVSV
jgi:hypothetical protein